MRVAGFEVGEHTPLFLIAGPCAIESDRIWKPILKNSDTSRSGDE